MNQTCGKCGAKNLRAEELETGPVPKAQVICSYRIGPMNVYHSRSTVDGYECKIIVPRKSVTIV